jgi:hypothetical protein
MQMPIGREIFIEAPVDAVWGAITEPATQPA